jgi:ribosome-binding factor A
MQESKRQLQVASMLAENLNDIFRRLGINMLNGGMVSISKVQVTPDLLEARVYLSFFKVNDIDAAQKTIGDKQYEIKRDLALRIKTQVRRIPVMHYFVDDTLDYVFKMEEVLKDIKIQDAKITDQSKNNEL